MNEGGIMAINSIFSCKASNNNNLSEDSPRIVNGGQTAKECRSTIEHFYNLNRVIAGNNEEADSKPVEKPKERPVKKPKGKDLLERGKVVDPPRNVG